MNPELPASSDPHAALTFGSVVLLFGTLSSLPPASLQDLQPVALLQLQDPQSDLVSERRA